ncbi:MAG TPA: response regulator [Candidatus Humimicrobiaceae bacterium]|nr:response regulator [Candidatus Humimicrobiaceae bacterium]
MKPKILIIEDDRAIIDLYKEVLPMAGLEIEILDLGKDAIKRLEDIRQGKKEKPDLILLDLILPDIKGIEILREARKYPETKNLKIYILTNYYQEGSNEELSKEGADKILIKFKYSLNELIEIFKEATKP